MPAFTGHTAAVEIFGIPGQCSVNQNKPRGIGAIVLSGGCDRRVERRSGAECLENVFIGRWQLQNGRRSCAPRLQHRRRAPRRAGPALLERTIGRQSGAAIGDPADDIDQSAAGCGREFGDASPRIAKSDNASSICCGKCPAQPATRLLLRNKNVLRGRFDHRLQQSFTIAGTGAQ